MPPPNASSNSQEDLSVFMGRFHTWDALQKGVAPAGTMQDLQEISYEEAMAARRRSGRKPMALNTQPVAAAQPADPGPTMPATPKASASAVLTEPTSAPVSKCAARKPASKAATRIAAPPVAIESAGKRKPKSVKAASHAPRGGQEAATFRGALAESLKVSPGKASAGSRQKKTAKAVKLAQPQKATKQALQPEIAAARTISVNLRLSLAEHARLRAGAAAAGTNLAAYIRENTLQITARDPHTSPAGTARRTGLEPAQQAARTSNDSANGETRGQSLLSRMTRFLAGKHFAATA